MSSHDTTLDSPASGSPSYGALVIVPHDEVSVTASSEWTTILSDNHQVVLYNSDSHALAVRPNEDEMRTRHLHEDRDCPYCGQPMAESVRFKTFRETQGRKRASNYFQLLEIANERGSRTGTPGPSSGSGSRSNGTREAGTEGAGRSSQFEPRSMAEGYFHAFFKEEFRLGMGANGSVFLCQVSLPLFSVLQFVPTFRSIF